MKKTVRQDKYFVSNCAKGALDDNEIEIEVAATPVGIEIMAPPGMEEMTNQLQSMFQQVGLIELKHVK